MNLDLARWQFSIVTVYHFLFVAPDDRAVGVGSAHADRVGAHRERAVPADDEVLGQAVPDQLRDGRGDRDRAGVPVRDERSDYSRFVGDVFGAPLAIEGLLAFFLESTLLGLWIFEWDRLPKRLHLACICGLPQVRLSDSECRPIPSIPAALRPAGRQT